MNDDNGRRGQRRGNSDGDDDVDDDDDDDEDICFLFHCAINANITFSI